MKICPACNLKNLNDAAACECGHNFSAPANPAGPPPVPSLTPSSAASQLQRYEDVPWYRREPRGALVLIALVFFTPLTIALCIICLSGEVYKREHDVRGNLKVWGGGNKVAAFLILFCQALGYGMFFLKKLGAAFTV
jgi:hypothetical protein